MNTMLFKLSTLTCVTAMFGALSIASILSTAHAQTTSRTAAHAAKHHRRHRRHHKRHHRIPQHNGGDHDADNNRGPTDGDGNV